MVEKVLLEFPHANDSIAAKSYECPGGIRRRHRENATLNVRSLVTTQRWAPSIVFERE